MAFSRDGRFVLTGSVDRTALLWDAATGTELRRFEGHNGYVSSVAFSPDGRFALTGSEDMTARLWDISTGAEVRRFKGHSGRIHSVAFSPDGRFVLTGSWDGTARLWDAATGAAVRVFTGHTEWVSSVAFSPDGRNVLTGSWDNTARLWDASTGRELRRFQGHSDGVVCVAFSPDGRSVLTASGEKDKTVRLWDAATGAELRRFQGHSDIVSSAAFSPDSRFVLTGSADKTARLWDASTGREVRQFPGHFSPIRAVAYSADGRFVLTGSLDRTRMFDAATGAELRRFQGRAYRVPAVAISPDGRLFLAGGLGQARLWDTAAGSASRLLTGHSDWVTAVSFSPDGRLALTASWDKTVRLWEVSSGETVQRLRGHTDAIQDAAFSPDGRFVLTGSDDKTARLWDVSSGAEIRRFQGHSQPVTCVAFSPDGRFVLTASGDKTARLWDAATGAEIRRFEGHSDWVEGAVFSPDGRFVLTGSEDSSVRLWDAATGAELRRFKGHTGPVPHVAFSADGRFVLTGSSDMTLRFWDAATAAEIRRFDMPSKVLAFAFTPGERFLLTGDADGTCRLLQISGGKWLATMISFADGGWAVVDPDGRYDASDPDGIRGLYWRVGAFRTIGLAQLRRYFYTPGLLGSIYRDAPLPPVKGLNDIASLPPVVDASLTPGRDLHVALSEIDKAGYGHVTIRINGRPFAALPARKSGTVLDYRLDGAHFAAGDNRIDVTVGSRDNLIESERASVVWKQAAARGVEVDEPATAPRTAGCAGRFYGIFVGVGAFPFAPELHLSYPEIDARSLADAVRLGAESLCGKDRVEIQTLAAGDPDQARQPTKENIRRAFQSVAAKSNRQDLLFVYLAGHGATPRGDPQSYFYLTQDARRVDVDIADKLRDATTISAAELVEWLINPNLPDKQVLILDTCAAAAANQQLAVLSTRARSLQDDLNKAADNFNLDTGTYILMGSARDRSSYESDRFRHGLLTYALLRGMKGDALLDGARLEAAHWFETAIPAVEKYAAMIGREQKPVKGVPSAAGGVPVGFLPPAVRERIVLKDPAPELLKLIACYQEPLDLLRDPLKLRDMIRSELRAITGPGARGGDAVSYNDNDSEGSADALTPQVLYRIQGAQLHVRVRVLQGDRSSETSVTVAMDDLQLAAKQIAQRILGLAAGK